MCKIKTHDCKCEEAVRYTYHNLRDKNFNSIDAMQSASEVLKHYHPELTEDKIQQKLFNILIQE